MRVSNISHEKFRHTCRGSTDMSQQMICVDRIDFFFFWGGSYRFPRIVARSGIPLTAAQNLMYSDRYNDSFGKHMLIQHLNKLVFRTKTASIPSSNMWS